MVDGTPILIHDENSVFAIADFTRPRKTAGISADTIMLRGEAPAPTDRLRAALRNAAERLIYFSVNASDWSSEKSVEYVAKALPAARILVVGAGNKRYPDLPNVRYIYTDVILGEGADYVCDLHDLPFPDGSFDAVIAVAVLEHVADPFRCASEITRVLRPGGYVYSVTPFMQQVHMGRYDFTRFTFLGHRRLFRHFTQIKAGMALGPAGALAWSLEYFCLSFFTSPNDPKICPRRRDSGHRSDQIFRPHPGPARRRAGRRRRRLFLRDQGRPADLRPRVAEVLPGQGRHLRQGIGAHSPDGFSPLTTPRPAETTARPISKRDKPWRSSHPSISISRPSRAARVSRMRAAQ